MQTPISSKILVIKYDHTENRGFDQWTVDQAFDSIHLARMYAEERARAPKTHNCHWYVVELDNLVAAFANPSVFDNPGSIDLLHMIIKEQHISIAPGDVIRAD